MAHNNILLESGTNELEIVEFHLDEVLSSGQEYVGYYGINVAKVLEIIRMPPVTEMPNLPHPSVKGAFNLRNQIIPLVDLCEWLGKTKSRTSLNKVIVTEFNKVINAFLVSGVTRIHRLSWEQIEPPSLQVQLLSSNSITGVVKMENRVIFLLDMEKIVGELNPKLFFKDEKNPELSKQKEISYKALIAEDSTSVRHMIGKILEKAGFEVDRCINGKDAWEKLESIRKIAEGENGRISDYLNLVVSDIEMPAMDGHNLTKRIKDDPMLKDVPVILFSSLITESLRHKGEAVGADDQVSKPDLPTLTERAVALVQAYQNR